MECYSKSPTPGIAYLALKFSTHVWKNELLCGLCEQDAS